MFAETSALLAVEAPTTSALSWEGIGSGSYDTNNHSHDDEYDSQADSYLQRVRHNLFSNSKHDISQITLTKPNICGTSSGLALLVSKDKKSASVTSNSDIRLMSMPLNDILIKDIDELKNTKLDTVLPLLSRRLGSSAFVTLANGTPPS